MICNLVWRYKRGALDKLLRGEGKEKRRPWTKEEKISLRKLLDSSATVKTLQSNFPDRSLDAVISMGHNSGWTDHMRQPWTTAELELLSKLATQGANSQEIAEALDRSMRSVQMKAGRIAISFDRDRYIPKDNEELLRMRNDGASCSEIGTALGRSRDGVRSRLIALILHAKRAGLLRLSTSNMQDVKSMIAQGSSWEVIQQEKFPRCTVHAVKSAYVRYNQGLESQQYLLTVSSADEQEIERLRDQKKTWQQIAGLKYPGWSPEYVQTTYTLQTGKARLKRLNMSESDILEIKRLRDAGKTFPEITNLRYPGEVTKLSTAFIHV